MVWQLSLLPQATRPRVAELHTHPQARPMTRKSLQATRPFGDQPHRSAVLADALGRITSTQLEQTLPEQTLLGIPPISPYLKLAHRTCVGFHRGFEAVCCRIEPQPRKLGEHSPPSHSATIARIIRYTRQSKRITRFVRLYAVIIVYILIILL